MVCAGLWLSGVESDAATGFYPKLKYESRYIISLSDRKPTPVISISARNVVMPPLPAGRRLARPRVIADWNRRLITISSSYYRSQYSLPVSYDFYDLLDWRIESSFRRNLASRRIKGIKKGKGRGGRGLSVTIPIKSKAVESLFGEGGAGLKVTGSRRISFAGNSTWTEGVRTSGNNQSRFPTLRMDQSYRFSILGTIGSKIFVKVNQDSRSNIPLANRLEIRFKGSDDDIIKTIEAGNTTLGLAGASLLRYSSRVRGLFGIKTEAQVGPFRWTAIASQEKANTERASIVLGSTPRSDTVRDYQYVRWRIVDLGLASHFENPEDEIVEFRVYRSINEDPEAQLRGKMYVDPRPSQNNPSVPRDTANNSGDKPVEEIDFDDYTIFSKERIIIFDRPPPSSQYIGIWLKMRRPGSGGEYQIGDISSNNLSLKLIKSGVEDTTLITWGYEWRNVYRLPSNLGLDFNNPDFSALDIKVYRGNDGEEAAASNRDNQDGVEYIRILGMDQIGSVRPEPDGKVDLNTQLVDFERRLMILPHRLPFATDTTFGNDPDPKTLTEKSTGIYNPTRPLNDLRSDSRYYFVFTSLLRSNTINLRGANIVDGSEVVTSNGETLMRGQDYTISGNSIQLTSERATDPAANVTVDYEVAPLFTVEKKTLLGTRLEYDGGKDFKIGTTLLYKSDKATTRKPKVGQETSKMFAWDTNFSLRLRPNFLTGMVDALPLIRSKGPSNLSIQGEMARSHPNPNVDGQAFIDDFEGSRQEISLGISRRRWTISSRPQQIDPQATNRAAMYWYNPRAGVPTTEIYEQEVTTATSATYPLNIVFMPKSVRIDTLIENIVLAVDTTIDTLVAIDTVTNDTSVVIDTIVIIDTTLAPNPADTLSIDTVSFYDPGVDITDTAKFLISATTGIDLRDNWSGLLGDFPPSASNQTNAELLEVRLRVRQNPLDRGGFIHFDLGQISEDVYPDKLLNQEGGSRNRIYDTDEEDVGLDGVADSLERRWYDNVIPDYLGFNDPAGDNFPYSEGQIIETPSLLSVNGVNLDDSGFFELQDLKKINGGEGNIEDPAFRNVDTEDIDGDGFNVDNRYFSFKASLDRFAVENNFYVDGSINDDGWFTIRIPIQEIRALDTIIGSASWTNIQNVRLWIDSVPDTTMIEIAAMELISSNWNDRLARPDPFDSLTSPSVFDVAVINTAEDANYDPPPGVTGSLDQINNIREPEQSLRLDYQSLVYGDTGIVSRSQVAANYTGYRELRMYVHGHDNLGSGDSAIFFFRLGSDSLNYYEQRMSLVPGWSAQNEVLMDFNDLTALKDEAIKNGYLDSTGRIDTEDRHSRYRVVGLPTLRAVRYIAAGVLNSSSVDTVLGITGDIWIDELRLTEVRRDVGSAARFSLSGSLGDFMSYNMGVSYQDAFYRGIAQGTRGGSSNSLGSGSSNLSYQFSVSIKGERMLPPSLKASIPIRFSYSRSTRTPLLVTAGNSDVILPAERRIEERTTSLSRGFSIQERFNKRTRNPLFTVLLNRIRTTFDYTRSESTSPTVPSSMTENIRVTFNYDAGKIPAPPKVPIFFMFSKVPLLKRLAKTRLNTTPTGLRVSSTLSRNLSVTVQNREGAISSRYSRLLASNMSLSTKWLTNLSSSFNMKIRSDLRDPDWVSLKLSDLRLGKMTSFQQSFSSNYSPSLFRFMTHQFSFSSSYSEKLMQNSVADTSEGNIEPLDVSQSIKFSASGTFDLKKFLGDPGKALANLAKASRKAQLEKQRRIRQRAADTSKVDSLKKVEPEKVKGEGGPWIGWRVYNLTRLGLRKITGFVDPISASIDRNQSFSKNGIRYRPRAAFRFGLDDDPDVPTVELRGRQKDALSQGTSWSLRSGVKLLSGGLSSSIDISESRSTTYPSSGSPSRRIDRRWPSLGIRVGQIRAFNKFWGLRTIQGVYNSFIRRFTPQTGYSRRENLAIDLSNNVTTSRSVAIDRSPLLAVTIPISRRISVQVRMESSHRERESFNPQTGALSAASRDDTRSLRASTQYSFRSPNGIKLPIFGRVRLQSNMTIKIDVLRRLNQTESAGVDQVFTLSSKTESFSVTTNINYSFSSQVKGGMSTTWTDTNNLTSRRKTHTRELRFYAEMTF